MSRRSYQCNCEERIKAIEDNLVLLQNLFVKGSVFIEGNLVVKGRISDSQGNPPQIDPCTAFIAPLTFNINSSQPSCRAIIQSLLVTGPSRVNFGQLTNGTFVFNNQSLLHGIDLFNIDSPNLNPAFQVPTRTQAIVTFNNGIITSVQEFPTV